jgi:hypothetical protein
LVRFVSTHELLADSNIQIDQFAILVPPIDFTPHTNVMHPSTFECEDVVEFAAAAPANGL